MRLIAFIEYCAIVAGAVAIVAGKYFSLHKGVELGYTLIGVAFVIAGLTSVYARRTSSPLSGSGGNAWYGARAVILGLMQFVAGAALIGYAYVLSNGSWPTVLNFISARPGPVLATFGLLLTGAGLLLIIGAGNEQQRIAILPHRNSAVDRRCYFADIRHCHRQRWRLGLVRSSRFRTLCEWRGDQTQPARTNTTLAQGGIQAEITCLHSRSFAADRHT